MPRELRVILAALAQMKKRVHGREKPHQTRRKRSAALGQRRLLKVGMRKKPLPNRPGSPRRIGQVMR